MPAATHCSLAEYNVFHVPGRRQILSWAMLEAIFGEGDQAAPGLLSTRINCLNCFDTDADYIHCSFFLIPRESALHLPVQPSHDLHQKKLFQTRGRRLLRHLVSPRPSPT